MPSNQRVQIKKGWDQAGRCGETLGDPVDVEQPWTPVLFDDDEDPTFHKSVGLEPERDVTKSEAAKAFGRMASAGTEDEAIVARFFCGAMREKRTP